MSTVAGGGRILLLTVAGFLSVSALLAVGILLFGDFGETEGRILGSTALLAGYGVLALPAAVLFDRRQLTPLASFVAALAALGAALALGGVWTGDGSETLGRTTATVTFLLVAAAQIAALAARRRPGDPPSVRALFAASSGLALVAFALATAVVWTDSGGTPGRVLAALVVLDVLTVALQPILARAQAEERPFRLRIRLDTGDTVERDVQARDLGAAAAKAIRDVEREGRSVRSLEPDQGAAGSIRP